MAWGGTRRAGQTHDERPASGAASMPPRLSSLSAAESTKRISATWRTYTSWRGLWPRRAGEQGGLDEFDGCGELRTERVPDGRHDHEARRGQQCAQVVGRVRTLPLGRTVCPAGYASSGGEQVRGSSGSDRQCRPTEIGCSAFPRRSTPSSSTTLEPDPLRAPCLSPRFPAWSRCSGDAYPGGRLPVRPARPGGRRDPPAARASARRAS